MTAPRLAPSSSSASGPFVILPVVNSLFAHASNRQGAEEGEEKETQVSHPHHRTHLPIVPFANDFEEVEVGGPGTGGQRQEHGSAFAIVGNLVLRSTPGFFSTLKLGNTGSFPRPEPPCC